MPLAFELNRGQTDAKVRFLTRAQNFTVFLMPGETVMRGRNADVLRMKLQNANQSPKMLGESRQRQVSNYYIGNDRSKWLQSVPNFGQVRYRDVYSGIDMVYHSDQRQLEYDFVVKPGADPDQIRVAFEGADKITLTEQGELELKSPAGDSVNHKPVVYQTIDGRRKPVEGEFALANNVVGFKIGEYDRTQPLVIDPSLQVLSFFGGVLNDEASGVATSAVQATPTVAGVVFVGRSQSASLPPGPILKPAAGPNWNAFATGLNGGTGATAGTTVLWTTYFGGSADDAARGVAMDNQGNVYVAGYTDSPNFPAGVPSGYDAFLVKLSASGGAMSASTLYGGPNTDQGTSVALDYSTFSNLSTATSITNPATDSRVTPNVVIGGLTNGSIGLAGSPASTTSAPDGNQTSFRGGSLDGFVAIFSSSLGLLHATYIGGSGNDQVNGVAVDIWGNIYATGYATPAVGPNNFPVARGIAQTTLRPNWDAALGPLNSAVPFVAKWACTTTVTPKNPIGVPSPPFGFVNGVNSQFPICGGTNNLKTLSNSALFGGLGSFINPQQIVAGQESITEAGLAIAVDQNGWGQEGVAGVASSLFTNAAGFPDIVPGSESGANCNGSASQNSSSNGTFVGAPKCAVSSSNSATTGGFEPGLSGPHVYIVGNTANRNFVNSLVFNASCTLAPFVSSTAVPALCPVPEVWGNGVTLAGTLPGGPTFLGPICDPLQQLAPGQAGYNPATGPGVCPAGGERLGDLRVKLATGLVNSGQTQGWLASFQFPAVTQDIVQPPLTTSPTTVTTLNPPTIPNYIVLQPPTCPPQGTGGTGCIEGEVVTPVNTPGSITTASPAPPAALGCAFTGGVFNSVTCPTPYIGSWNAVAVDSDQQVYVLGQIGMSPALVDGVATAGLFGTGPPDRLALEFERIGPYANTPPGNSFLPNFCPGPANAPCAYPENLFPVSGAGFGSTTLLVDAATGVGGGAGSIFGSSFGQILPGAPPFPNPNAPGGLGNGIAVNPTREAFFVGTSTVVTAPGVIPVFVTANTSTLSVDYITIVTALTGYSSLPTCTITGGGGSGATCSFAAGQAAGDVQLVSGQIRSGPLCTAVAPPASHGCGAGPGVALFSCPSCVTAGGTNYTTAPTVTLTPTPPTSGALNYLTAVSTAPAVPPVPATEGSFAGFGGVNAGENCTLGADGINPPSSANPCSGTGPEDVIYGAVQFFDAIATPTVVNFTATVNNFSSITAPDGLTGSAAVATINYSNWQALPLNIPPGCIVTPHVPIGRDGVNPDFVLTAIPGTASFTVSVNSTAAVLGPVAIPGVSTSLVTFTKGDQCAGLGGAGTLDSWDPLTLTLTVSAPLNLSPENTFQITSKLASGVVDQYFAGGTQIVANQFLTFGVDVSTANAGGPINFTAQIVGGQNWSGSVTNSVVVPLPTDIIYEAGGVGSAGGTVRVPVAVNTLVLAGLPIGTYTAYIVFTASPETPDLPTAGSFNCGIAANVPVGSGTTSPACIPIVITITPGQVANSGFLVFGSSTSSQQTQVQISNPTSAAFNFTAGYTATPVFGTALPAAYVSLSGTATIAPIPATLGATVTGTVPAGGVFSLPVNVNPNPGGGLPLLPTGVYSGQILFSTNGQASGATPQTTVPLIVYVGPHAGEDLPSGNGLGLMLPVNVPPIGTGGSQGTGTGCPATAPASCAGGYPLTLSVPSGVGPAGFDQIPNPTLLEVTGLNNASTTAFSVGAPSFTVTSPASTSSSFVTFTNPGAGFGGTPGTCGSTYASLSALPNSPLGPSCAWGLWIDATNLNSTTTTAQAACGGGLGVSGTITFSPASGSFPFAPLVVPLTICVTDAPALILDVPNTFPNPTYGPSAFTGLNSPQTEPSNLIPGFPQSVVSMILAESNNVTVNATAAPINLLASQGNSTPVCQILSLETNGGVVNNVTIAPITSPFLSIQSLATLGTAGAVFLGPGLVSGAPNTLQWNSGGASFFNFTGGITGLGGSLSLPASPPFAAGPVTITPSVQTFAICGNTDEVGNATGIFSGTVTINGAGVGSITIPVNLIVGNGSPSTGGSGGSLINVSEIGVFRSGAPFGTGPQPAGFVLNSESSNQLGGAYNFPQASADGKVLLAPFGLPGDIPVAGNWNGTGAVTIGVFRNGQWILDLNNNGVFDGVFGGDGVFIFGQAGDQPVVGDWNGDGRSKFGIFRPSTGQFILDFQGHMTFDASAVLYSFGLSGDIPVAGNWSGGKADFIGVFRPSTGQWILDTAGNGVFSASSAIYNFGLSCSSPGPTCDQPVVGNWGNGTPVIKRIGVFRPSTGQWILSNPTNGNWVPTDPVFQFGEAGDSAIVGFWTLP